MFLGIIYDFLNLSLEEYDQDEWKMILKSYAKLEAGVKDENEGLDNADKGEEEDGEEDDKEGEDEEEEEEDEEEEAGGRGL